MVRRQSSHPSILAGTKCVVFLRRHQIGGGVLRLNANAQPGEYILQIVVTDQLARKNKSKVTQWVDFEVLNPPQKIADLGR